MKPTFNYRLVAAAVTSVLLTACGDADTTIVEQPPVTQPDDGGNTGGGNTGGGDNGHTIESLGRIAVLSAESNNAVIVDLDDAEQLDTFALTYDSSRLTASADYRYAVISARTEGHVGFIDGGLWREDHGDHLHDYEQAPESAHLELHGAKPTHVVKHDGQLAIFFDGDADAGTPASVQVLTDNDITNENEHLPTLNYAMNMHGVAEPRGEYLIATVRRDDADSTSGAKILPDQVGVYHKHDEEYEQDHLFELTCPDLHGAAQNEEHVAFGCGDGVMIVTQEGSEFSASKIANTDAISGARIGTLLGHEESESFIGIARQREENRTIFMSVDPHHSEMEEIEWHQHDGETATETSPVAYGFSYEGDHFLILDNQGMLTVLAAHQHGDHTHWEIEGEIDISEQDIANMPEGLTFSMTIAQNGNTVYVADPIARHVVQVDIESQSITGDYDLDIAASSIAWLGIAEEHAH